MLTLLSEARFWTCKDEISIKDTDFGAYKYHDKREIASENVHTASKRSWAQKQGIKYSIDNKSPLNLRKSLKKLEDLLRQWKVVYCQWKDNTVIQLMLSNGLIIHICINIFTGDINRLAFDKYFIGKLIAETISDVIITRMHIVISYHFNQITFVCLQKPTMKRVTPEKIARMDPKLFNVIIGGPHERKIPRHIVCNSSYDMIVIWTKSSQNEVYPWRPTVRDQDRANVHIYKLGRLKVELVSYYWTENDPVCVEFSKINQNHLTTVEQKISRKGDVTIENCVYEMVKSKLQRVSVTSIPLQTQVCCHSYSPDHAKLLLGCIDGSLVLYDEGRSMTHLVKAAFIPTLISWHCDSSLITIANDRCQFQCFDISLSCVRNQLISEDMTPTNLLDLSGYFSYQPTLERISWNRKPDLGLHQNTYTQSDSFLLLLFENGPLACVRFFGGAGLKGDVHTSGFTTDVLIHKYLNLHQIEKAINLLLCLNWDISGAMCLISLHKIANFIFKQSLTVEREVQLQKALGSFHIPVKPLYAETVSEFGEQVRDITRKFFQYLLRYKSFEKAFSLAIDINDDDLFMDLHNNAKQNGHSDLADEALRKADEILNRLNSRQSSHSTCSNTSCSICSDTSSHSNLNAVTPKHPDENFYVNTGDLKHVDPQAMVSRAVSSSSHHPPLPVFQRDQSTVILIDSTPPYVPPLPYSTATPAPFTISIPKPELKLKKSSINFTAKSDSSYSSDALLPRVAFKQHPAQHRSQPSTSAAGVPAVMDVVPKSAVLDQTLGIPVVGYNQASYAFHVRTPPAPFDFEPPIVHQYPLISGHIPATHSITPIDLPPLKPKPAHSQSSLKSAAPRETASILSNGQAQTFSGTAKREPGEKNKVKFSDTVTVAVVPEIHRKEKPILVDRSKKLNGFRAMMTDPRRELADSLPLCHPNDDYLKDFTPMSEVSREHEMNPPNGAGNDQRTPSSQIKVVHFGVV